MKKIIISEIITIILVLVICFITLLNTNKKENKQNEIIVNDITNGVSNMSKISNIYDKVVTIENYLAGKIYKTGTGFVYKNDKDKTYIITNYHVISSANDIYVVYENEKEKAKVVGYDMYMDIAVLSLDSNKLKPVILGDSDNLKLGSILFVIGSPIDPKTYERTVTQGILSGKDRLVSYPVNISKNETEDYYIKVLQTDAGINSGNSGGPLCNINGEVIGIVNLKMNLENTYSIGFAIPINDAKKIIDKIINGDGLTRPYLRLALEDILKDDKEYVIIKSIKNEYSRKYKLKENDILLKIDNIDIINSAYLKYLIYKHEVGDNITITYLRDNKEDKVNITLESK